MAKAPDPSPLGVSGYLPLSPYLFMLTSLSLSLSLCLSLSLSLSCLCLCLSLSLSLSLSLFSLSLSNYRNLKHGNWIGIVVKCGNIWVGRSLMCGHWMQPAGVETTADSGDHSMTNNSLAPQPQSHLVELSGGKCMWDLMAFAGLAWPKWMAIDCHLWLDQDLPASNVNGM